MNFNHFKFGIWREWLCVCEVNMDSDSDFEGFPSSQISFCGFNNSQSADYGGDIVDSDKECGDMNVVSLENSEYQRSNGETRRILYDNVEIEDISSDDEIDAM